jgi:hypothetical protein
MILRTIVSSDFFFSQNVLALTLMREELNENNQTNTRHIWRVHRITSFMFLMLSVINNSLFISYLVMDVAGSRARYKPNITSAPPANNENVKCSFKKTIPRMTAKTGIKFMN